LEVETKLHTRLLSVPNMSKENIRHERMGVPCRTVVYNTFLRHLGSKIRKLNTFNVRNIVFEAKDSVFVYETF